MKKLMQLLRDNAERTTQPLALVRNEGGTDATLYLYDVIDAYWGIGAQAVANAIAPLTANDTLHLRINSPGGDVFEGRAMAALLRGCPANVVAHIDALCASAATTVALACDSVEMDPQGFFMIHEAWSFCIGNKADMQEMGDLLNKIDAGIEADYAAKTGKALDEIKAWMQAETWFTAQEALDNGFVDSVVETSKGGASNAAPKQFNLQAFKHAPKALLAPSRRLDEPDWAAVHANNQRRLRLLEIA